MIRVVGPETVIPEVTRNANGVLVHLVNWNEQKPALGVRVSLLALPEKPVTRIRLLSPDRETTTQDLPFTEMGGRIEFVVPRLVCYNLIVVESRQGAS